MGGGLCWLDYDDDGWLDLYVVNAYADDEYDRWTEKRRPAAQRALPQRARQLRGRQSGFRRRPAAARKWLRRSRLQPGRQHRSVRDRCGLQRRHQRLRRSLVGERRRDVHGRGAGGRDQRARLALRRRRRRRERRRQARSVRRGLRRHQRRDSVVHRRLPRQPCRCARPPLPQPGPRQERPLPVPRRRQAGRSRARSRRPRPRGGLHGRGRRRAARPLRRQRPRPESPLPERRPSG